MKNDMILVNVKALVDDLIAAQITLAANGNWMGERLARVFIKIVKAHAKANPVDAEPVVRCKDCVNRGNELECPMCRAVHTWNEDDGSDWYVVDNTADDGYCHCGERMDGGAEDAQS